MLDGQTQRNRGAERFAEIDDTRRIDVPSGEHVRARRLRVGCEAFLIWRSWVAAVPTVVGQQHMKTIALKRGGGGLSVQPRANMPASA